MKDKIEIKEFEIPMTMTIKKKKGTDVGEMELPKRFCTRKARERQFYSWLRMKLPKTDVKKRRELARVLASITIKWVDRAYKCGLRQNLDEAFNLLDISTIEFKKK